MVDGSNKRTYYRVNDHALLKIRAIDAAEQEILAEAFERRRLDYSLTTHISHQRQQRLPLMTRIRKQNPDVATYLDHLEAQLEMLAGQLVQKLDFDENARPQPVNLSATGLRYESPVAIEEGQPLEIGLLLQPEQRLVLALGTAVRVENPVAEPAGGGAAPMWSVSVSFERISDEDQELLIRHVHGIQRAEVQSVRAREN